MRGSRVGLLSLLILCALAPAAAQAQIPTKREVVRVGALVNDVQQLDLGVRAWRSRRASARRP